MHTQPGDQGNHPHDYEKPAYNLALVATVSQVYWSKRYSAMPDLGATMLHKLVMRSPNSLMNFTCSFR